MRMIDGEALRFSFVRDPVTRFESAYRSKILGGTPSKLQVLEVLGSILTTPRHRRELREVPLGGGAAGAAAHGPPLASPTPQPRCIRCSPSTCSAGSETLRPGRRGDPTAARPSQPARAAHATSARPGDPSEYDGRPDLVGTCPRRSTRTTSRSTATRRPAWSGTWCFADDPGKGRPAVIIHLRSLRRGTRRLCHPHLPSVGGRCGQRVVASRSANAAHRRVQALRQLRPARSKLVEPSRVEMLVGRDVGGSCVARGTARRPVVTEEVSSAKARFDSSHCDMNPSSIQPGRLWTRPADRLWSAVPQVPLWDEHPAHLSPLVLHEGWTFKSPKTPRSRRRGSRSRFGSWRQVAQRGRRSGRRRGNPGGATPSTKRSGSKPAYDDLRRGSSSLQPRAESGVIVVQVGHVLLCPFVQPHATTPVLIPCWYRLTMWSSCRRRYT